MPYLTDEELIEKFEYYLLQLEERMLEGQDFRDLIDQIPCATLISRIHDIEIIYTNKKHHEVTGYSLDEVRDKCTEFLKDRIHPTSLENIRRFLPEFYNTQHSHQTTAFVQYVKKVGSVEYSPFITLTKPPKEPNGLVIRMPIQIEEFGKISSKMEQIVKMDQFKLKHFKRFQQLTKREIEILKMLANGCNNPKIADQLFISRSTVETHRKNLKRKLGLRSFRDLMRYAFAFDLVEC